MRGAQGPGIMKLFRRSQLRPVKDSEGGKGCDAFGLIENSICHRKIDLLSEFAVEAVLLEQHLVFEFLGQFLHRSRSGPLHPACRGFNMFEQIFARAAVEKSNLLVFLNDHELKVRAFGVVLKFILPIIIREPRSTSYQAFDRPVVATVVTFLIRALLQTVPVDRLDFHKWIYQIQKSCGILVGRLCNGSLQSN